MKNLILNILIISYGAVGLINIVAYWPTIKDLYHHKKPSANTLSFYMWTFASGVTFLYSLFILPDLLFQIVSGLNFLSCFTVLVLSIRLKNNLSSNK